MKGTLLTVALLVFAGTSSLMAQNGHRWGSRDLGWQRASSVHHYDRYRDMRQDERAIEHDKWEIREDMRRGDYRAAQREREELRERERDLYRDRHGRFDQAWGYRNDHVPASGRKQGWDWSRFNSFVRR